MSTDKLPNFSTFNLDDFDLNKISDNSLHRGLKDSQRSFLLYLEPIPNSPLHKSLTLFQEKIFSQFGPNQAHNTSPHLSIIPRILIKKRSNTNDKWQTVQDLIQLIDQQTKNLQLPVPDFAGYQILERPTRSLVMNIKVHNDYYMLIEAIELCIGPSCAKLDVSLLDRIHLAYNVLKSPSKSELKKMKGIAESTIDVSDWIKLGGTWKLTLYEVMVESQVVGVQHQLKEVHSWPIHQRPPQPFIDLLPVFIRIKLPWLNNASRKQFSIDNSSNLTHKSNISSNKGFHTI